MINKEWGTLQEAKFGHRSTFWWQWDFAFFDKGYLKDENYAMSLSLSLISEIAAPLKDLTSRRTIYEYKKKESKCSFDLVFWYNR